MKTFSWCVVKCIFGITDEEAVELLLPLLEEEINSFPELLRLDKSVIWIASAPGLATDIAILERFWKSEKKVTVFDLKWLDHLNSLEEKILPSPKQEWE